MKSDEHKGGGAVELLQEMYEIHEGRLELPSMGHRSFGGLYVFLALEAVGIPTDPGGVCTTLGLGVQREHLGTCASRAPYIRMIAVLGHIHCYLTYFKYRSISHLFPRTVPLGMKFPLLSTVGPMLSTVVLLLPKPIPVGMSWLAMAFS